MVKVCSQANLLSVREGKRDKGILQSEVPRGMSRSFPKQGDCPWFPDGLRLTADGLWHELAAQPRR